MAETKKLILLAGMILGAGSIAPAHAADIPVKAPAAVAAVQTWTGLYGGINGGYAWGGDTAVSFTANDITAERFTCGGDIGGTCPGQVNTDLNGGFGGLQLGYNRQVSPNWLFGVEIDFDLARIRSSGIGAGFNLAAVPSNFTAEQDIKWFATFRGRIGYLVTPGLLLFGTGGFAIAGVDESSILKVGPTNGFGGSDQPFSFVCRAQLGSHPDCFRGSHSRTATGWTAGGGFEYAVARNLTVKTEYLYVGLNGGATRVTAVAGLGTPLLSSFTAHFDRPDFHLVRFGLNYNFGGCANC